MLNGVIKTNLASQTSCDVSKNVIHLHQFSQPLLSTCRRDWRKQVSDHKSMVEWTTMLNGVIKTNLVKLLVMCPKIWYICTNFRNPSLCRRPSMCSCTGQALKNFSQSWVSVPLVISHPQQSPSLALVGPITMSLARCQIQIWQLLPHLSVALVFLPPNLFCHCCADRAGSSSLTSATSFI